MGRLSPQAFIVLVGLVYPAGAASHALTIPDVITRTGLWPFIAAQVLLIWIWYALHTKRLRDGGRATGLAAAAAILYALAVALMIIVGLVKLGLGDHLHAQSENYRVRTPQELAGLALVFLLLKAFSSGCTALTGVEAISNGVPAERDVVLPTKLIVRASCGCPSPATSPAWRVA